MLRFGLSNRARGGAAATSRFDGDYPNGTDKRNPKRFLTPQNEKTAIRFLIRWRLRRLGNFSSVFLNSELLARANCTRQPTVVNTVSGVPKRLAKFDPAAQYFDLFRTAGRRIGWLEMMIIVGYEIFIVAVTQNRFENIFAGIAHL